MWILKFHLPLISVLHPNPTRAVKTKTQYLARCHITLENYHKKETMDGKLLIARFSNSYFSNELCSFPYWKILPSVGVVWKLKTKQPITYGTESITMQISLARFIAAAIKFSINVVANSKKRSQHWRLFYRKFDGAVYVRGRFGIRNWKIALFPSTDYRSNYDFDIYHNASISMR